MRKLQIISWILAALLLVLYFLFALFGFGAVAWILGRIISLVCILMVVPALGKIIGTFLHEKIYWDRYDVWGFCLLLITVAYVAYNAWDFMRLVNILIA